MPFLWRVATWHVVEMEQIPVMEDLLAFCASFISGSVWNQLITSMIDEVSHPILTKHPIPKQKSRLHNLTVKSSSMKAQRSIEILQLVL